MKPILFLIILTLAFGCKQESIEKAGNVNLLRQINIGNKIYQTFEFDESLLMKERVYGGLCKDNPIDEYEYTYHNGKPVAVESTTRGFYSSLSALCDPALGIQSTENFEYDIEGRISKIVRQESYTLFEYNGDNQVEKQTIFAQDGTITSTTTFRYDANGNLVEETDQNGASAIYEYDDKLNPFYLINHRPGWISPFNQSPNNVIKATGKYNFERKITYNSRNLPVQVMELNSNFTYYYSN